MKRWKWKDKRFAIVHPRRGQKYRLGQLCVELHKGRNPSIALLADVFGIAPATIYAAMRAARPNGHARPVKSDGDARPAPSRERRPVVRPTIIIEPAEVPVSDPWSIAHDLVHTHGVDQVFDRVISPAIS